MSAKQGRYSLWGRRATVSALRLQFVPQTKFCFFKNLVKTKLSLHNSSIHRNVSVFLVHFCRYGILWLTCQFSASFTLDLGNLAPTPPSPGFDKNTTVAKWRLFSILGFFFRNVFLKFWLQ